MNGTDRTIEHPGGRTGSSEPGSSYGPKRTRTLGQSLLLALAARSTKWGDIVRLASFGVAYLVGLLPTLVSNAINAGSVLATTYSAVDATPPDFSFSVARQYYSDMQGALILLIATWSIVALASNTRKTAAAIVAVNIVVNLGFFLTHPISTAYYLMPLVLLSLWTLLFSFLNDPVRPRPLIAQTDIEMRPSRK
jgi:hypothetical protein